MTEQVQKAVNNQAAQESYREYLNMLYGPSHSYIYNRAGEGMYMGYVTRPGLFAGFSLNSKLLGKRKVNR